MGAICFDQKFQNYTRELEVSCIFTLYLTPALCGFGFCLNVVCGIMFCTVSCRRNSCFAKSSMSVYLIALCVFDAFLLILSVCIFVLPAAGSYLQDPMKETSPVVESFNTLSAYSIRYLYPLLMTVNYASIWTITVICVQRYCAVCHPFGNLIRLMEIRQSRIIVVTLTCVAFAVNSCRYMEYNLIQLNGTTQLMATELSMNYSYIMIITVFYTLLVYIIPFCALSVLNVIIIRTIYQSKKFTDGLTNQQRREHRSTFMILAVIISFFACNTLTIIYRWIDILDPEGGDQGSRWLILDISNFLVNVSSTGNPFIYFICTRRFKDLFMEIMNSSSTKLGNTNRERMPLLRNKNLTLHTHLHSAPSTRWSSATSLNQRRPTSQADAINLPTTNAVNKKRDRPASVSFNGIIDAKELRISDV